MKKAYLSILLLSSTLISGCADVSSEAPILTKTFNNLNSDSNLSGVDANHNGIRDDVDTWIDNNYNYKSGTNERRAIEQAAKAFQSTIITNVQNKDEARKVLEVSNRSIYCLYERFDNPSVDSASKVIKKLLAKTTNTRERILERNRVSSLANGMSFRTSSGISNCD